MTAMVPRLPLAVVGCDFRIAPSALRSRLVVPDERVAAMASSLASQGAADGLMVLNTCNRNEWIVSAADPSWAATLLQAQMKSLLGEEARGHTDPYVHLGEAAARHVFRVALGMESLVTGERQIAGQLHQAFQVAREKGRASRVLNGLATAAGRVVRLADKAGHKAQAGRGVHSLAVDYLRHAFAGREGARVVVVGMGSIGRRAHGVLAGDDRFRVTACNRTVAPEGRSGVRPLAELPGLLPEADALLVCTGAGHPVLDAATLAAVPRETPLLIVDIGIPEQVARQGLPEGVTVVGLDELASFYKQKHCGPTELEGRRLEAVVDETLADFAWFCSVPDYAEILDALLGRGKPQLHERIARVIGALPDSVTPQAKSETEREIKVAFQDYINEVLASIKQTGRCRLGEST